MAPFPPTIQLNPAFRFELFSNGEVLLRSEHAMYTRSGQIFIEIFKAVETPARTDNLVDKLRRNHSDTDIEQALADLLRTEAICAPTIAPSPAAAAYAALLPCPPESAEISVEYLGDRNVELENALRSYNILLSEGVSRAVVITDDYLRPGLAGMDEKYEQWLLAKLDGSVLWMGPLFTARGALCWSCMEHCIRPHRWQAIRLATPDDSFPGHPSLARHPAASLAGANLLATAIASWMATGSHSELEGAILTLDLRNLRQERHVPRGRLDCPKCRVGNGGKLEDLVSPITGIVRKVETTPQPVVGLFHSQAHFVHALPVGRIRPLLKPQVGIGKGFSALNARTTAIAEAVERHSLVFRGDEHRILARVDELDAIHPQMLLHFSEKQYSNRAVWNTLHSEFQRVPDPFEDDKAIEWSPATDLSTKEVRYVPTAYCYMWYASSSAPSSFCNADTNGCAAGATRDEALQNGLLELVERDAVAIWWYNQLQRHAVDLKSFGDPSLLSLRENLTCAGRDLQILDLTTDLGIPVYAAVIAKRDGSQPCFGCAAHLSPRTAALKAACEASQILFWTGQQTQADEMTRFLDSATLERNSYLRVRETRPAPPEPGLNIQESLDYSVSRIVNAGIRPLWADLTRADIGVPVVRVIAPGLRHVWARFAPGRLYDVPVQQGWLNRPKTEDELNPLPCML